MKVDICVIGAGSAGLSIASGASQMGASTVLIERGKMGGDCLNTGCVPSKAMLAAAHSASLIRTSSKFGIDCPEPEIDGNRVYAHIQDVIKAIEPNDSVERFEGLGVNVIRGSARFIGSQQVQVGETTITARRIVVATGSRAAIPPIPGLDQVNFHTNENIFERKILPKHLIIIGGGPIGIEMAQAHRRLGCQVTVLEMFSILPKDDPELVEVVRQQLIDDLIDIREGAKILRVEQSEGGIAVFLESDAGEQQITGTDLLIAAGRLPNVEGLDLEKAGVGYSPKGIEVDARLKTSNKKIFAAGDVTGGYQFTHVAGYHAGIIIKNALFRLPAKSDMRAVPWVTYGDPELAQVGLTEEQAKLQYPDIRVLSWPFQDNDRAQAEGDTRGLVKVIVTPKGKILGCGIVGAGAGELIQIWVLAMSENLKIGAMTSMVAPYPTRGEISKRAAGSFYTSSLFSERTRKIVKFLGLFG